jgi:hypothetical protein
MFLGGMQDWNYLNSNCFELTIELNCAKFPHTSELYPLWQENKFALVEFIRQVSCINYLKHTLGIHFFLRPSPGNL